MTTFEKRYQQSSNATTFRNAFQNTRETVPRSAGCVWGEEVRGQALTRRTEGKGKTPPELLTLDLKDLRGGWLRPGEPSCHQASNPARWGKREGTGATGCPPWGRLTLYTFPCVWQTPRNIFSTCNLIFGLASFPSIWWNSLVSVWFLPTAWPCKDKSKSWPMLCDDNCL